MNSKQVSKLIVLIAFICFQFSCQKGPASNVPADGFNTPKDSLTLISAVIGGFAQSNAFFSYDSITKKLITKYTPAGYIADSTYFYYKPNNNLFYTINVRNGGMAGSSYVVSVFEYDVQNRIANIYTKNKVNRLSVKDSTVANFSSTADLLYKDSLLYDNKNRVSKIFERLYSSDGNGFVQSIYILNYNFPNDSLLSDVVKTYYPGGQSVYIIKFNSYDTNINPLYRDFRNAALCPTGFGQSLDLLPFQKHMLSSFLCFSPNNCTNVSYSVSNGIGTNYSGVLKYEYNIDSLPSRYLQPDERSVCQYRYIKVKK